MVDTLLQTKKFDYYRNGRIKEIREIWYETDSSLTNNPFKTSKKFGGIAISNRETEENINNNGILKLFYKSGQIERIAELKKTNYNGSYLEFHENGNLKIDAYLIGNKFHGKYLYYDNKGNLEKDYRFLHGIRQE